VTDLSRFEDEPMGWLPKTLRRQTTTVDRPLRILYPTIGFLNLAGEYGADLAEADRAALSPMFRHCLTSSDEVPKCDVLFLYCELNGFGQIAINGARVGDIIKRAQAYIAVIASDNDPQSYMRAGVKGNSWPANTTMTLNRNGEAFVRYWQRMFREMFNGKSMLIALVEIAPQFDGPHQAGLPGTMMVAEAGHITFA
jgi:hypothetical protein